MKEKLFSFLEQGQYEEAKKLLIAPFAESMRNTHQNPVRHGEDDVLTHTDMVVDGLVYMEEFRRLEKRKQSELFCAAVLHDIGKPSCTVSVDGVWKSPYHAEKGAKLAREYLWREFGMAGEKTVMRFRETVCTLIRYHDVPLHFLKNNDIERKIRRIAANGELASDFSMEMLYVLSKADTMGRVSNDRRELLDDLDMFAESCEDLGCFSHPYLFTDAHTEFSYLNGKNIAPDQSFYNDTWGEVFLMSALPGTGKDTYIKNHLLSIPMISLDEIRKEFGIKPTDEQGIVFSTANERAREFLRAHQPFVWNATNITDEIRKKRIDLFTRYGASVRILYLEADWNEELSRNAGRDAVVPENVIENMLHKLNVPERYEASAVEWITDK